MAELVAEVDVDPDKVTEQPPTETMDEMEARHKKEARELEGRIRAMIKDSKRTAGAKKAKQAAAEAEAQGQNLRYELRDRHRAEVQALEDYEEQHGAVTQSQSGQAINDAVEQLKLDKEAKSGQEEQDKGLSKKEKARRKREKKAEKEAERQRQIEEESANVVSERDIEMDVINQILQPLQLKVHEIPADGHCLYSALADQLRRAGRPLPPPPPPPPPGGAAAAAAAAAAGGAGEGGVAGVRALRRAAAAHVRARPGEFAPFLEEDLNEYCEKLENTATWGGHLELQALSQALGARIRVYSAAGPPLTLGGGGGGGGGEGGVEGEEEEGEGALLRVSYHQHYYALGAHYNSVVPR